MIQDLLVPIRIKEWGKKILKLVRNYMMGIINVTSDSLADGGKYNSLDRAVPCKRNYRTGVDIIDIRGK